MNCSRAAAEFGSSAPSEAISPDTEKVQLIVIHMRVFDWPILMENVARYGLEMPKIQSVFCSQKTAISWAR